MKKILIIADGILAKHFLERVVSVSNDSNEYTIVHYKNKTLPDIVFSENFKIHSFDPTSLEKMMPVMKEDFYQVMIALKKKVDAEGAYKNVRQFNKKIPIYLIDRWGFDFDDKYLTIIESREVVALRFADFLPNTPVIAQNVGLAMGEVMDVQVPVGSSYVYRHIGGIEQKKWHIAAVYRNNMLLLPKPTLMIQPNDSLLIVGAPEILQNVYKSIKQELGQFPLPFGSNIYCFVDMKVMSEGRINRLILTAKSLHERLNSKKLYIKVINPTYSQIFTDIKTFSSDDIDVTIDFYGGASDTIYKKDVERLNIGLCVTDKQFFKSNMKMLFDCQTPIFKNGSAKFEKIKRGVILGGSIDDAEKNSSAVFDISTQLGLQVQLYDFDPDKERSAIIEHFENIAKLYEKKIDIAKISEKNPILEFRKSNDILQFIPFYSSFFKSKIFSLLSEDLNQVHFLLEDKYQLFLPILE
ncbi:MAG: potassium transporter TrkA [Campylobacteraceae bacterium]|jgi:hypothetical protein|nr:potassium transporter TrkA [Campylobacteraceae bacterium]